MNRFTHIEWIKIYNKARELSSISGVGMGECINKVITVLIANRVIMKSINRDCDGFDFKFKRTSKPLDCHNTQQFYEQKHS